MLADWIIGHFPPAYDKMTYLEPFFGSGAVFFSKKPSKVETINDIDAQVINLFRVIRENHEELCRLVEMTPWARAEYEESYEMTGDPLEDARRFLVRAWQAHGSSLHHRHGWRNDTIVESRGTSYTPTWRQLPARILAVVDRLKGAQIENRPALELIKRHNHRSVLIYADPPYVHETRSKRRYYAHEMLDEDHIDLLTALNEHEGPVLLSGYENGLYDEYLAGWHKSATKGFSNSGKDTLEILWLNEKAKAGLSKLSLFDMKEG